MARPCASDAVTPAQLHKDQCVERGLTGIAPVHNRMPVILRPELEQAWLDPEAEAHEALSFLQPYPAVLMKGLEASPLVNSVRNDFPALLEPEAAAA